MAHRHKLSKGGRANPFKHNYTAPGSGPEMREAEKGETGFKRGGHHAGKAHGGKAKHRADRRARGGSVFSAAGEKLRGKKAFASPPHHSSGEHGVHFDRASQKGSSRKGHAGRAEHQYAEGGTVAKAAGGGIAAPAKKGGAIGKKAGGPVAKNRGGECEPAGKEGADGEEEEDGHKRGGRTHGKMHYVGGGHRKHKKGGGHIDVYETHGGTHHWDDDDHHRG